VTCADEENVNSDQYRFIAQLKINNISYYSKSRYPSSSKNKYINNEVEIIYDPNNPEI
jgi:hypothetical protein